MLWDVKPEFLTHSLVDHHLFRYQTLPLSINYMHESVRRIQTCIVIRLSVDTAGNTTYPSRILSEFQTLNFHNFLQNTSFVREKSQLPIFKICDFFNTNLCFAWTRS